MQKRGGAWAGGHEAQNISVSPTARAHGSHAGGRAQLRLESESMAPARLNTCGAQKWNANPDPWRRRRRGWGLCAAGHLCRPARDTPGGLRQRSESPRRAQKGAGDIVSSSQFAEKVYGVSPTSRKGHPGGREGGESAPQDPYAPLCTPLAGSASGREPPRRAQRKGRVTS